MIIIPCNFNMKVGYQLKLFVNRMEAVAMKRKRLCFCYDRPGWM